VFDWFGDDFGEERLNDLRVTGEMRAPAAPRGR